MIFKKYITFAFILTTIFGCTALWVLGDLDNLVKNAIDDYGSKMTQSRVTTGNLKININDGTGIVKNFSIENPKGFNTPYALKIKELEFSVDPSTFKKEVTVINQIKINNPDIVYEKCDDETNFEIIENNIKEYIDSFNQKENISSGDLSQSNKDLQRTPEPKKFIIKEIVINNPKIAVSAAFMKGRKISVTLPSFVLNNIGTEKSGIPASEIGEEIVHVLRERVSQAVNFDELKNSMKSSSEKTLELMGRDREKALKKIKSLLKD